jgi:hypothetical protein
MHREKKSSETPLRNRLAQLAVRALDQATQLRPGSGFQLTAWPCHCSRR